MVRKTDEGNRSGQEKRIFKASLVTVSACGLVSALLNLLSGFLVAALGLTRTVPALALANVLITVFSVLLPAVCFSSLFGGIRRCTAVKKRLPAADNVLLGLFGVGACVTLNFLVSVLSSFLPFLGGESSVHVGLDPVNILMLIGAMAAVPALCEELAFRGFAFTALQQNGVWYAAVVSSLIFGMLHASLSSALFAFLSGVLFAVLRRTSGRLLLPIIVHFVNNTLAVLASAAADTFSTQLYDGLYLTVLVVGIFLMLAAFVLLTLREVRVFPAGTRHQGIPLKKKLQYTFSCVVFDGFLTVTLLLKFL